MTSKKEVWSTTEKRFVEIEIEGSQEEMKITSKRDLAFVQYLRKEYGEYEAEVYKYGYILGDSKRKDDEYHAFQYALKWLIEEAKTFKSERAGNASYNQGLIDNQKDFYQFLTKLVGNE